MEYFNLIIGILNVIAFGIAVWQTSLAISQQSEAKKLANELNDIRLSMSTRYIGNFPEYMPDVVRLIANADKNILIACSIAIYGLFSSRTNWLDYKSNIEKKLNDGIPVDFIYSSSEVRRNLQEEQFRKEITLWKANLSEIFRKNLQDFVKHYTDLDGVKDITPQTFLDCLEKQNKLALEDVFKTANKTEIGVPFGIHFWVVDETSAIFVISSFAKDIPETGFLTSDAKIVASLISLHQRYKDRFASQ